MCFRPDFNRFKTIGTSFNILQFNEETHEIFCMMYRKYLK